MGTLGRCQPHYIRCAGKKQPPARRRRARAVAMPALAPALAAVAAGTRSACPAAPSRHPLLPVARRPPACRRGLLGGGFWPVSPPDYLLGQARHAALFHPPCYSPHPRPPCSCVKPNAESRPGSLAPEYVLEQLRAGGVLEAVRIACAGAWAGGELKFRVLEAVRSACVWHRYQQPASSLQPAVLLDTWASSWPASSPSCRFGVLPTQRWRPACAHQPCAAPARSTPPRRLPHPQALPALCPALRPAAAGGRGWRQGRRWRAVPASHPLWLHRLVCSHRGAGASHFLHFSLRVGAVCESLAPAQPSPAPPCPALARPACQRCVPPGLRSVPVACLCISHSCGG